MILSTLPVRPRRSAGELAGAGADDVVLRRGRSRHDGPFLRQLVAGAIAELERVGDFDARLGRAEQSLLLDDPGLHLVLYLAARNLPARQVRDHRSGNQADGEGEEAGLVDLP